MSQIEYNKIYIKDLCYPLKNNKTYIDYFDYTVIPEHMMESILNYVNYGYSLGGFLTKLFSNDLFAATAAADSYNLLILPTYIKYIFNECPSSCHGSYEIVKAWKKEIK